MKDDQLSWDFLYFDVRISPVKKELNEIGIFNIEQGLFFVRESLKLTKAEYDSAVSRLRDFDRFLSQSSEKAHRQRWTYIISLGLSFYCFQRLQQLSKTARQHLWDEYEVRTTELLKKEVL